MQLNSPTFHRHSADGGWGWEGGLKAYNAPRCHICFKVLSHASATKPQFSLCTNAVYSFSTSGCMQAAY